MQLVMGRVIAGTLRRAMRRGLERAEFDAALVPFPSSAVYYLAMAVVVIAVLNLFGIQTTSLVAILGAAGLAIGLGLQGTLSNVAAGMMLLVFRPFRLGDYVEAGGEGGAVREIDLFTTKLDTPDNVRVVIPNSVVYGGIIRNYGANDTRRLDLVIGISYADDIGTAIGIIEEVLRDDARVLPDPVATVAVGDLGASSVDLVVRPWCASQDYWPLRFDLTRAIKERLEAGGCSIPFPQRDVHVYQPSA